MVMETTEKVMEFASDIWVWTLYFNTLSAYAFFTRRLRQSLGASTSLTVESGGRIY